MGAKNSASLVTSWLLCFSTSNHCDMTMVPWWTFSSMLTMLSPHSIKPSSTQTSSVHIHTSYWTSFLSCSQPFGTDFRPSNWEVVCQVLEHLSTQQFHDNSLQIKNWHFLDKLPRNRSLSGCTGTYHFTRAQWDALNSAMVDAGGTALPTPYYIYVDVEIYVDIFLVVNFEQFIAATIKAIYIFLGASDLTQFQDPISFDKLTNMTLASSKKFSDILLTPNAWQSPHSLNSYRMHWLLSPLHGDPTRRVSLCMKEKH